jgi:predicted Zn-dependent protease with MMP-like domain
MRTLGTPPSADEIEAIARRTLDALPEPFAASLPDIVLLVEEFADEETLETMGIEDPFDLTGIYEGVPLTERSVDQSGILPERIRLFRRPILDEWW